MYVFACGLEYDGLSCNETYPELPLTRIQPITVTLNTFVKKKRESPILMTKIPIAQPSTGTEEESAATVIIRSGMLAQGPAVAQFEEKFSHYCDVKHAIAVNSGTAALHAALARCSPGTWGTIPGKGHRGIRKSRLLLLLPHQEHDPGEGGAITTNDDAYAAIM